MNTNSTITLLPPENGDYTMLEAALLEAGNEINVMYTSIQVLHSLYILIKWIFTIGIFILLLRYIYFKICFSVIFYILTSLQDILCFIM